MSTLNSAFSAILNLHARTEQKHRSEWIVIHLIHPYEAHRHVAAGMFLMHQFSLFSSSWVLSIFLSNHLSLSSQFFQLTDENTAACCQSLLPCRRLPGKGVLCLLCWLVLSEPWLIALITVLLLSINIVPNIAYLHSSYFTHWIVLRYNYFL